MINFIPPVKVSLLVTIVYLICFQIFLHTGHFSLMLPANIFFILCCMRYVSFLTGKTKRQFNMMRLLEKGVGFCLISSLFSFISAIVLLLVHLFIQPSSVHVENPGSVIGLIFANGFLANFVCGSLAVFFVAGIMNERRYSSVKTRHLSSVKL